MKFVFLKNNIFLKLLLIIVLTGVGGINVFAGTKTLSNSYSSVSECNNKVIEYNSLYSNYFRTSCFKGNDNKYYYNICESKTDCESNFINDNTKFSQDPSAEEFVNNLLGNSNNSNPYVSKLDQKTKKLLDSVINKILLKKDSLTGKEFNELLNVFDKKLNKLKNKFSPNQKILNFVGYLQYEIKGLYVDVDIEDFFCELIGNCGTSNTNENSVEGNENSSNKNEISVDKDENINGNSVFKINSFLKGMNVNGFVVYNIPDILSGKYLLSGTSINGGDNAGSQKMANIFCKMTGNISNKNATYTKYVGTNKGYSLMGDGTISTYSGPCNTKGSNCISIINCPTSTTSKISTTSTTSNTGNTNNINKKSNNTDDYNTAFSEPGYNLILKGLEKNSDGKYKVGNFISYDMIKVSVPGGVTPSSCILRTNDKSYKYLREIEKNPIADYRIPISKNTKTIDLMCGFAGFSPSHNPHLEIRTIGCTKEQIQSLGSSVNAKSVYGDTNCNIVHKRLFLEYDSSLPSYENYYLNNKGYKTPKLSINIDKSDLDYMEKAKLSWTIDGDIDYCQVNSYDLNGKRNYIIGKVYNSVGLSNNTHIKPIKSGSLEFYATKSGIIKIDCIKNYKMASGKTIKLNEENKLNIKVNGKESDLLKLNASSNGGDQVKVEWEISPNLDLNTCTSNGFSFNKKRKGSIIKAGSKTSGFRITCTDPTQRNPGTSISNKITIYKKVDLDISKYGLKASINVSKNSINKGEATTLSREIYGYEGSCYIQDAKGYNSIGGKKQMYVNGKSSVGSVKVTPYKSTMYKLQCGNQSNGGIAAKTVTVDGVKIDGTITNKNTDYGNEESKNTKEETNNTTFQIEGVCNHFNINYTYKRNLETVKSKACKVGKIKAGSFKTINYSKNKKHFWKCEGQNGGGDTRECRIRTTLDKPSCGSYNNIPYTNKSTIYTSSYLVKSIASTNLCAKGELVKDSFKIDYGYGTRSGKVTWKCSKDTEISCGVKLKNLINYQWEKSGSRKYLEPRYASTGEATTYVKKSGMKRPTKYSSNSASVNPCTPGDKVNTISWDGTCSGTGCNKKLKYRVYTQEYVCKKFY